MEMMTQLQQNRRIIHDFASTTLAAIPGMFARLTYVASLRDLSSGAYEEEGPQVRVNPEGEPVVLLLKSRERRKGRVLAVINSTAEPQEVAIPNLAELLGEPRRGFIDLTPDTVPLKLGSAVEFTLPSARMRIFYNPDGAPLKIENPEKYFEGGTRG